MVNRFFKDVTCGSHAACLANRPNESSLDRHRRIKLKLLLMGTRRKKKQFAEVVYKLENRRKSLSLVFRPKT